jgi:hypothetical protein
MILVAERNRFYLYDYGDQKIKAYTMQGKPLWEYGRSGHGPGEFANPTDLAVAPDRSLWISDPPNGRITVLDSVGALLATIPQPSIVFRTQPLSEGRYWVWHPTQDFVELGDSGGEALTQPSKPRGLAGIDQWVRELFLVDMGKGGLAVIYKWSSNFYVIRGPGRDVVGFEGVLQRPFPQGTARQVKTPIGQITRLGPDPKSQQVTRGGAFCDGSLTILAADIVDAPSVVDDYDGATGKYLGSRRLPQEVSDVDCDVSGKVLVALIRDPSPAVVAWRWVPE